MGRPKHPFTGSSHSQLSIHQVKRLVVYWGGILWSAELKTEVIDRRHNVTDRFLMIWSSTGR